VYLNRAASLLGAAFLAFAIGLAFPAGVASAALLQSAPGFSAPGFSAPGFAAPGLSAPQLATGDFSATFGAPPSASLPGIAPLAGPAGETPEVFSLIRLPGPSAFRRAGTVAFTPPPPPPRSLFGYTAAYAEELPHTAPAVPAGELLFTHAALGVAVVEAVSGPDLSVRAPVGVVPRGGAMQPPPAMPSSPMPSPMSSPTPSPLPIPLLVLLVIVPAVLVLAQALIGASRPTRRAKVSLTRR